MKGQFLVMSSIIIGLIFAGIAFTVQETGDEIDQDDMIKLDRVVTHIHSEVERYDIEDPEERRQLEESIESIEGVSVYVEYVAGQDCLSVDVTADDFELFYSCIS